MRDRFLFNLVTDGTGSSGVAMLQKVIQWHTSSMTASLGSLPLTFIHQPSAQTQARLKAKIQERSVVKLAL
jgi:hypothetical protein